MKRKLLVVTASLGLSTSVLAAKKADLSRNPSNAQEFKFDVEAGRKVGTMEIFESVSRIGREVESDTNGAFAAKITCHVMGKADLNFCTISPLPTK